MAGENTKIEGQEEDRINEGRRRLLKILAASGGTIAVSTALPENWVKPVVDWGVLPVHAQVSPTIVLSNLQITISDDTSLPPGAPQPSVIINSTGFRATFHYDDGAGQVSNSAQLFASISPCGELIFNGQSIGSIPGASILNGTGFAGFIGFPFVTNCNGMESLCVKLGIGTRLSNQLCGNIGPG